MLIRDIPSLPYNAVISMCFIIWLSSCVDMGIDLCVDLGVYIVVDIDLPVRIAEDYMGTEK